MNIKKISWFILSILAVYFVLFLLSSQIPPTPDNILAMLALQIGFLWTPGIIAMILHGAMDNGKMSELGLIRKYMKRSWFWVAAILPYFILGGTVTLIYLMGNLLHIPGFGEIVPLHELFQSQMKSVSDLFAYPGLQDMMLSIMDYVPTPRDLFIIIMVMGIAVGPTLNLFFTLGEEIAWRGFLLRETQSLGFWKSNFLIGTLWTAVMLPLIMASTEVFPWMDFFLLWALNVSLSYPLAYLNLKANSVLASAAFRGVFSFPAAALMFMIIGGSDYVGSMTGLAGIGFLWLVIFMIRLYDPNFFSLYKELRFEKLVPSTTVDVVEETVEEEVSNAGEIQIEDSADEEGDESKM